MPWTSPRTWVAGEVVTAALMNTHVRDNLNFIATLLTTGTLTNRGVLYGSGTAAIGATPALGAGAIVVGGTGGTADPSTLVVFAGTAAIGSYRLLGTYGGLNADVSTATAGAVVVASSTGTFAVVAPGPSGQFYQSRGTGTIGTFAAGAVADNLGGASGSVITSAATNIASVVITGLTPADGLYVFVSVNQQGAANPSSSLSLQISTALTTLDIHPIGSAVKLTMNLDDRWNAWSYIYMAAPVGSNTLLQFRRFGTSNAQGAGIAAGEVNVAGVPWTGTITLIFRANDGSGAGTLHYMFQVKKVVGT